MSNTKATAKPTKAARDFVEAGTGKRFAQGDDVEATGGELANYRAAGLIAGDDEEAAKPTE